jgi:hypothetical protein
MCATINSSALIGCGSLTHVTIPNCTKISAKAFYENLAKKFHSFASRQLLPRAIEASKEGDFKPFSAVMVYNTEETEEKILVTIQAFVFDGACRIDGNVTRQYWDKKTGLLMAK